MQPREMAGTQELLIVSWNIHRLCNPARKAIIKNWLQGLHKWIDILVLQESKADDFRLETALAYRLPTYQIVISYPNNGYTGTALLVHPSLTIKSSGGILRGAAWENFSLAQEQYFVSSIYAPNIARDQKELWHAIAATTQPGI
jgi:exonuclease III